MTMKNSKLWVIVDCVSNPKNITKILMISMSIILLIAVTVIIKQPNNSNINVTESDTIESSDEEQMVISSMPTLYELPVVLPSSDTDTEKEDLSEYNITYAIEGSEAYTGIITIYTDLMNRNNISEADINRIIDGLCDDNDRKSSNFKGTGRAFIYASQMTGYDPIFLISLALNQSNYNAKKINGVYDVYNIGSYDGGYIGTITGDSIEQSIINGALYLKEDYYNWSWETTISDMCYGTGGLRYGHSSSDNWAYNVASMMNKSYSMLFGTN